MTSILQFKTFMGSSFKGASIFIAALGFLSISTPTYAQRVEPMSYTMAPSGNGATQALRIENTSQSAMTVELTVNKITVDDYGNETKTPAEDDFLIFPPQAIIKPQAAR